MKAPSGTIKPIIEKFDYDDKERLLQAVLEQLLSYLLDKSGKKIL